MTSGRKPSDKSQTGSSSLSNIASFFWYPFQRVYNSVRPLTQTEKELKLFDHPPMEIPGLSKEDFDKEMKELLEDTSESEEMDTPKNSLTYTST